MLLKYVIFKTLGGGKFSATLGDIDNAFVLVVI
jgi:hypothetical protein